MRRDHNPDSSCFNASGFPNPEKGSQRKLFCLRSLIG